jgi:hypothetical protein
LNHLASDSALGIIAASNAHAESRSTPRSGFTHVTNDSLPERGPTKRKIALVVALAALVILSLFVVTAGNFLVTGKSPLWTYHTNGTINSISIAENGSYIAVGVGFNLTSGAVLLLDRGGNLLWEHKTNRIVGGVSISGNGSRIEANGYQLSSGPGPEASFYENAEVYALVSNGSLLWNRTASIPWSTTMSADGSRITVVGTDSVALLTWEGQTLWNYTAGGYPTGNNSFPEGPPTFFVSQNGTRVPVGADGITRLGSGEDNILVNDGFPATSASAVVLTPNGTLVAPGNFNSGINGTVHVLTPQGDNDLELFNSGGRLMWSYPLYSVLTDAVSGDGTFVAAASGLTGQGGTGHPSTLYFFSTTGNGGFLLGLEDELLNYSQSPSFILFELGTGITMVGLFAALALVLVRESRSPMRR